MNDNKVARGNDIFTKKTIAALVVFGAIIAFPLAISDKHAFGTNSTTTGAQSPFQNDTLPAQSQYNKYASQKLAEINVPLNKTLPRSINGSDTGLETKHQNDWITGNHDIFYTRSSNQTIIGKDNVDKLQVKWILNDLNPIEQPPIIIGDKGYVQDNKARVIAFDVNTGLNLWKVETGEGGTMHGVTYDRGILFAATGGSSTVVAINATDGKIVWKSQPLAPDKIGYEIVSPPIVWKDFVVVGSSGGDLPTQHGKVQGNITALDRTNGHILWNFRTTQGSWVGPGKSPPNGGATTWSGGSFDPSTGILYNPTGNATPDFNATGRPEPNNWVNHMIALNITNGKMIWATPFLEQGTVIKNVRLPDTHDWDVSWGSSIATVKLSNGLQEKMVLGHDKRGDVMAMDSVTGKPIWWTTVGIIHNDNIPPNSNGSVVTWPGTQGGVEAYHALDNNNTLYLAVSNTGYRFYEQGINGYEVPAINSTKNGLGNGTIIAMDIKTGKIKWEHPTEFPTWVSPLVSNGVVFAGHITAIGKPYTVNVFGAPLESPLLPSGIIMALDKDTGKTIWQFNVGAPIGISGPSLAHGMLFVPIGSDAESKMQHLGSIIAFGLPQSPTTITGGTPGSGN